MQFNAVIDVSSIIWDEADFDSNKHHYYNLLKSISHFLEKLVQEKPIILMRDELLIEMSQSFPSNQIPNDFWYIVEQVYSFLANSESNFISHPSDKTPELYSIPNLIKSYYNEAVKDEIDYLLSHLHIGEDENIYFTFEYLWNSHKNLKTQLGEIAKTYETIIVDKQLQYNNNLTELDEFFSKLKPIFEHYEKHDKSENKTREAWEKSDNKKQFISQLTCYNGVDNVRPQEILDLRYPERFGNHYYGYDSDNEVYITFMLTRLNIFHAFDEYDENRIPDKVRKHFNK